MRLDAEVNRIFTQTKPSVNKSALLMLLFFSSRPSGSESYSSGRRLEIAQGRW